MSDETTRTTDVTEVRGVWITKDTAHNGGELAVHVELTDGTHRTIFTQDAIHRHDGPISHYAHARGFTRKPVYDPAVT